MIIYLLKICFIICLVPIFGVQSACTTGWFGKACQYKCHCINNNCDSNGACHNRSSCSSGWFGPACQYQDLLSMDKTNTIPSNTSVLKDRDDNTCLTGSTSNITVTFDSSILLTWIRFTVKQPEVRNDVTFLFNGSENGWLGCKKIYLNFIDQRTVDVLCDSSVITRQVILTGAGVSSLCSLYISGGRNVALKQSSMQSSSYSGDQTSAASNAVDGNTEGQFSSGSCTHTADNDPSPAWNLTFTMTQRIHKYVIYNRESFQERLIGFILSSFNSSNSSVFDYTFQSSLPVYTAISLPQSIAYVKIFTSASNRILTLCEVELYGETACDDNVYGLECNKSCNCENKTETCYVATGGCTSGCAAGFYGEDCLTPCPSLLWGVDCLNSCSSHCVNQTCNSTDGFCDLGCDIGFAKYTCTDVCPHSTWGQDCSNFCSVNCISGACNSTNGVCSFGCNDGYRGENCTQTCPYLTWGQQCSHVCSLNCRNETCDNINGACHNGCLPGYMGDNCTERKYRCSLMTWGENCANPCSDHCVNQTCDRFNGTCDSGCQSGFTGDMCDEESTNDDYKLGIGLGLGLTLLLAVCVCVVVVVVIIRSRHCAVSLDVMKNAAVTITHTKTTSKINDEADNIIVDEINNSNDYRMQNSSLDLIGRDSYITPRDLSEYVGSHENNFYSTEDQDDTIYVAVADTRNKK